MKHTRITVALLAALTALPPCHSAAQRDRQLTAIQKEIEKFDGPYSYYATQYRPQERSYWNKIPGWMRQDANLRGAGQQQFRILDIGCGYGTLLVLATEIYKGSGYCIDVIQFLRPNLAKHRGLHFQLGNIELDEIPWPEKFDVVVLTEVLEHFNFSPLPTLRKIREALSPDGRFFLSTPDATQWGREYRYYKRLADMPSPQRGRPFIDGHIWIYDEKELRGVLDSAGFSIERLDYAPGSAGHRHFNLVAKRRD